MTWDALRRWMTPGGALPAWAQFAAWARANRWTLKRTIAHDGWVMDHGAAHPGWRIEWGPAQRSFMSSHEFRIRFEVPDNADVQAMVLDRPLLARLDRELYAQFVDSVQTRIDEETPEEMRWLAMHAKLTPNELGPALRDRYGAVSNDTAWATRWLSGPVAAALKQRGDLMPVESVAVEPFILRLARGQVVIRQSASAPGVPVLATCVAVGEAVEQALRRGT